MALAKLLAKKRAFQKEESKLIVEEKEAERVVSCIIRTTHKTQKNDDPQWNRDREFMISKLEKCNWGVTKINEDGNCLFSVFALQIFGDANKHKEVRDLCIKTLKDNRDDYEPFLDVSWDKYIANMESEATWGGHMEMRAISTQANVDVLVLQCEHQIPSVVEVVNEGRPKTVVLLWIGQEHFDSVMNHDAKDASIKEIREQINI